MNNIEDLNVNLGLSASYDDLRTQSTASSSLKKQAGNFSEFSANYGLLMIKEIEHLCQQVDQLLVLTKITNSCR